MPNSDAVSGTLSNLQHLGISFETEALLADLFPFKRHYFQHQGHKIHYVDEGNGDVLVMLHGNPSWSFYYRNLITALKANYRCIALDHLGCGLSDKPKDEHYSYQLQQRIDDLQALLRHLQVGKDITLVLHDWGGMIGMGYAARYPAQIKRLVLLNTAAFHLPSDKSLPLALKISRDTFLGNLLIRGLNAFAISAANVGVKRLAMAKDTRTAYLAPYNNWHNRIATLKFVQDIPLSPKDGNYQLVSDIQAAVKNFIHLPTLVCWGMQDFVFDRHFFEYWKQLLPDADYYEFADAGHYILEDASDEVIDLIQNFLTANPLDKEGIK